MKQGREANIAQVVAGALLNMLCASLLCAQSACPSAGLPGYSHNDYENARPLTAALDLGYRGIEADVFLVDGVPNDARVYRMLLDEGVDLIGTETITRARELLANVTSGPKR